MKSFFRFVFLALVLVVVALISALTAMRLAIHGQEVRVPDLLGKTPGEARKIAESLGFQLVVERQYYSPTVAEGKILSQLPASGMTVRRGWQIGVAQSLGPQRVEIPNVLGETERAAEFNIRRRGLDIGALAHVQMASVQMPSGPPDQVVAQSPAPNASQVSSPKIGLLTAETAPPQAYVMPNFAGQPLGNAKLVLQEAGMKLGPVSEASGSAAPGVQPSASSLIVSQNPPMGGKIVAGSAVSFEVR